MTPPPTPNPLGLDPRSAARLVIAVAAYRALHGVGPTWREARVAAGWPWDGVPRFRARMLTLKRAGLLTFTRAHRSLDATAAGKRWALAVLAPERRRAKVGGDEAGGP
jgi:hypothetical protein